jgi:excisionase family DNA binding protein
MRSDHKFRSFRRRFTQPAKKSPACTLVASNVLDQLADVVHPEPLNTAACAAVLGVSERTVELFAESGQLKGHRSGTGWRFSPAAIRNFIAVRHAEGKILRSCLRRKDGNPWFFRTRRTATEAPADQTGRRIDQQCFRRGGSLISHIVFPEPLIPPPPTERRGASLYELRRERARRLALYRNSGIFSDEELSLIEARFYNASLTKWRTRHRNVSREAVSERLRRLEARVRAAGLPGWRKLR